MDDTPERERSEHDDRHQKFEFAIADGFARFAMVPGARDVSGDQ